MKIYFYLPAYVQARSQDLAARGPKTRRKGQKPEVGANF